MADQWPYRQSRSKFPTTQQHSILTLRLTWNLDCSRITVHYATPVCLGPAAPLSGFHIHHNKRYRTYKAMPINQICAIGPWGLNYKKRPQSSTYFTYQPQTACRHTIQMASPAHDASIERDLTALIGYDVVFLVDDIVSKALRSSWTDVSPPCFSKYVVRG